MLGALLYLRLTSLKNQLISRAKRLRQLEYLLGALVGGAYIYFLFFRNFGGASGSRGAARTAATQTLAALPSSEALAQTLPLIAAVSALLLLGIVILAWVIPSTTPGLRFTEAETAFLFPAPISRRTLIHCKLLSSQFSILFTSLFFTLISNRWTFLGGNALTHAFGWWFVLSTLNLHFTGAALTLSRLVEGGVSPLRRRLTVLGGLAVVVGLTVAWVWRDLRAPDAEDFAGVAPFTAYLLGLLDHGVLGALLVPFKFVVGPFLAPDTRTFLFSLAPALLVMVAHYSWVLRMETSFEEASLAAAEKRSATLASVREGKSVFASARTHARPGPFYLGSSGRPELAFLWKNLLSTATYFNLRVLATAAAIILVGSKWFLSGTTPDIRAARVVVGMISLTAGAYVLLLGPHLARQDLRGDMPHADILKTYPLRGWELLLGQILTPVAILTGLTWLCLLGAALTLQPTGRMALLLTPSGQWAIALGIAALTPFVCALQLLILNGATIIFPAWFHSLRAAGPGGGIELMGQRLIFVFGQFIVILTALLPASLTALALIFATQWLIGATAAIALATLVVLVVLAGEVWCALWWLGERFDRLDVSSELRP